MHLSNVLTPWGSAYLCRNVALKACLNRVRLLPNGIWATEVSLLNITDILLFWCRSSVVNTYKVPVVIRHVRLEEGYVVATLRLMLSSNYVPEAEGCLCRIITGCFVWVSAP